MQECRAMVNGLVCSLPSLRRLKLEYQVPLFAFEEVISANRSAHRLVLEMPIEIYGKNVRNTNCEPVHKSAQPDSKTVFYTPQLLLHDFCFSPISLLPARLQRMMHQFSDNRVEFYATATNPPNEKCSWYGLDLVPKLTTNFNRFYVQCIREYFRDIREVFVGNHDDDFLVISRDKVEYKQWFDRLNDELAKRQEMISQEAGTRGSLLERKDFMEMDDDEFDDSVLGW
nr:hypothetical protein CFP56_31832 [Quercus suber]